jgi:hypothetical protein
MSTISKSRPWGRLAVLGVAAAVSACGAPPVAPTPVTLEAAASGNDAGRVVMAVEGKANLTNCRRCVPEIDPQRIPPNVPPDFLLGLANTGDAPAGVVHVSVFLVSAEGRRLSAAEADVAAPRPGETSLLRLRLVVPLGTRAGEYALQSVVDPDNRIPESDETDNTWLADARLTVP